MATLAASTIFWCFKSIRERASGGTVLNKVLRLFRRLPSASFGLFRTITTRYYNHRAASDNTRGKETNLLPNKQIEYMPDKIEYSMACLLPTFLSSGPAP